MAKYLLLAEKPSVMRAIRQVYMDHRSEFKDDFEFGAFHGHLMELEQPRFYDAKYQKWNEADLPIIPNAFVYGESDPESCNKLMATITAGHYDALINACDAGREGEHIFFSFYEAHKLTIPVLRFWASDTTDITVLKTLKGLLPASQFDGMRQAAKFRAQFDWLSGINFSRAASLRTGKKLNIGRVISPTLKIIVDRERDILNFTPKDFFEIQGKFKVSNGEYGGVCLIPPDNKQTKFSAKAEAEKLQKTVGKTGKIQSVENKRSATKAPTLYSLLELQKDGSKYFGYSAEKTLNIAQSLYEKWKVTTYPRTESRFLPTAMVPEIQKHLNPLMATDLKAYVQKITQSDIDRACKGKDYVDNAKITDHHAIIPTTETPKMSAMSSEEQNVYLLICKRFLSIFMPPYTVDKTTIITDINGILFKTTGKVEVDKGYGALYTAKTKDIVLPAVSKGESVSVTGTDLRAGKTTPPDRFNTATLLDAMQNAGNFVSSAESRKVLKEAAGLGTSATRASILQKLEDTGMVNVKKTVFSPTDFGMALIDTMGDRLICSPEMTANWEKKLRQMEEGSFSGDFRKEMNKYITEETADMLQNIKKNLSAYDMKSVGKCPKCGADVVDGKNYYRCANYKQSCNFIVCKTIMGAAITAKDISLLLAGKETKEKSLTTNAGKTLKSAIVLVDGVAKPAFVKNRSPEENEFLDPKQIEEIESLGTCPACGGKIYEGKGFYLCANRNHGGCNWSIKKEIKGAKIGPNDIKEMLSGGTSSQKTFTWSSGKKGTARLQLENERMTFIFDK